jgi:hypothetical protein
MNAQNVINSIEALWRNPKSFYSLAEPAFEAVWPRWMRIFQIHTTQLSVNQGCCHLCFFALTYPMRTRNVFAISTDGSTRFSSDIGNESAKKHIATIFGMRKSLSLA